MVELPKTEAELQALIDEKVNTALEGAKKDYEGKLNAGMASARKDYDSKLAKAKADYEADLDVRAEEKAVEKNNAFMNELNELRAFKKSYTLSQRLSKEGLPDFFKNDSRLLNASDDDFEKALKDVKKEYEATLPKGNTVSTVVNTGGKAPSGASDTDIANEKLAETLGKIIGK